MYSIFEEGDNLVIRQGSLTSKEDIRPDNPLWEVTLDAANRYITEQEILLRRALGN